MCQTCGNRMHKRPISSQPSTLFPLSHSLIQNLLLRMNSSSLSLSFALSRPLGFYGGTSKNLNRWEVARGHPLGAEHTHCAAACQALAPSRWHSQACRGIDPSSTLHTLHFSHCCNLGGYLYLIHSSVIRTLFLRKALRDRTRTRLVPRMREWWQECEQSIWSSNKNQLMRVVDEKREERRRMGERDGGLPWAMLPSWVCLAPVWAQLPVGTNHGGLAALRGSWQLASTHTHIITALHSQTCIYSYITCARTITHTCAHWITLGTAGIANQLQLRRGKRAAHRPN